MMIVCIMVDLGNGTNKHRASDHLAGVHALQPAIALSRRNRASRYAEQPSACHALPPCARSASMSTSHSRPALS